LGDVGSSEKKSVVKIIKISPALRRI